MLLEIWILFLPASFVLNMAPGPNNLLAMSNGVRFGFLPSILGGLGRIFAFSIMITLTAIGLGAVLSTSELAFSVVKWFGTAYLIYLGVRIWRQPVSLENEPEGLPSKKSSPLQLARQEFFIAIGNPKAILIFTAFFPQFMSPVSPVLPQLVTIGSSFLVLEFTAISIYALLGKQLGSVTNSAKGKRLFNRFSGGMLIGSGSMLALLSRRA